MISCSVDNLLIIILRCCKKAMFSDGLWFTKKSPVLQGSPQPLVFLWNHHAKYGQELQLQESIVSDGIYCY